MRPLPRGGEGGAAGDLGSLCPLALPCCRPVQQPDAVAGPALGSPEFEDLPFSPPGKVPRGQQLGRAYENSSEFGESKAKDEDRREAQNIAVPHGQGAEGAERGRISNTHCLMR